MDNKGPKKELAVILIATKIRVGLPPLTDFVVTTVLVAVGAALRCYTCGAMFPTPARLAEHNKSHIR